MPEVLKEKDSNNAYTIDVYLLAAAQEQRMCQEVKKHLKPIVRNSKTPIEIHSDFDIPPGQDIKSYKEKLFTSEIVLAFISVDYFDSDETALRTQKVIERYNHGQSILLPILARNCQWKSTPFVNLPLVPENLQPINNKQYWNSEDDALTEVANEIYNAINQFSIQENKRVQSAEKRELNDLNEDSSPTVTTNMGIRSDWRKAYYKKAGWHRAKAFILDNLITTILALLPVIYIKTAMASEIAQQKTDDTKMSNTELFLNNIILYILPLLVYLIVYAIFESSKWRGTIGKMIMKLQTTDIAGNKISFFKALWRNILKLFIGGLWIFIPLDFYYFGESTHIYIPLSLAILPMIFQIRYFWKSKKLIHDKISKTVVGEKLKH